jgi:hypothetical protein
MPKMMNVALVMVALAMVSSPIRAEEMDEKSFFRAQVETAKTLAVEIYPDVTNANSRLCQMMESMDREWEAAKNPYFYSAMKPILLAHLAAQKLGIAPTAAAYKAQPEPAPQIVERSQAKSNEGNRISNTGQMMSSPENAAGPRTVLMNGRSYMVQENGNTTVITGTRAGESFTATQNGDTTVITGGRSHVLDY